MFITRLGYIGLAVLVLSVWSFVAKLYFFQDDFFLLSISKMESWTDLASQFVMRRDVVYYRPLSMQLWYGLGQLFWGKQPLFFHSVVLALHLINAYLVWRVITLFTRSKLAGYVTAALYGSALLHFIALVWIAEFSLVAITTVFLVALWLWWKWIHLSEVKYLVGVYMLSATGFLVHELAIVIPILLGWVAFIFAWMGLRRLRVLVPLLLLSGLYGALRLWVFPQATEASYAVLLGVNNMKTFAWYAAWSLNIPEEMVRQVDSLLPFVVNAQFQKDFQTEMFAMKALLFVLIGSIVIGLVRNNSARMVIGFLGWFVIGLGPFVLLPGHAYPMYATVACIGLFGAFSSLITVKRQRLQGVDALVLAIFVVTWIAASSILLRFTYLTHWAVRVAGLAEEYIGRVSTIAPFLPYGSVVRVPDNESVRFALMGDLGVQVMIRQDLHTAYTEKELQGAKDVYTVQ